MHNVRLTLLCLFLLVQQSRALIMVGVGNQPVSDSGWPSNAVDVANLKSRVGWWEGPPFGGGEWHFEYVGDADAFQQTVNLFAKIQSPALDLFIHDGTQFSFVADPNHKEPNNNIDWTFVVWDPSRWQRLYGSQNGFHSSDDPNFGKPMQPPRLDLYPDSQSKIAFEKIKVSPNVTVHDERASAAGVDTSAGTVLLATISDAHTHRPIPGARLIATARDEQNQYTKPFANAVSEEKGIARMTGIPGGVFQISAVADGYVEAAVDFGDYPEHIFKKFNVELARGLSVSGSVTDESEAGVPDIRVVAINTLLATNAPYRTLKKPEALTDAAGKFILTNLPAGLVQIWTYSTNYFSTNLFAYHPVPGPEVSIPVRQAGALLVKIQDVDGRGINRWQERQIQVSVQPVGGSVIGSYGGGADVSTNGMCLFSGAHPDNYEISVSPPGKKISAVVEPGRTTEVQVQLP